MATSARAKEEATHPENVPLLLTREPKAARTRAVTTHRGGGRGRGAAVRPQDNMIDYLEYYLAIKECI